MPQGPQELVTRIYNDFTLHPPKSDEIAEQMDHVRASFLTQALFMADHLPPGRELSTALTKLEEACFWSIGAIARNQ